MEKEKKVNKCTKNIEHIRTFEQLHSIFNHFKSYVLFGNIIWKYNFEQFWITLNYFDSICSIGFIFNIMQSFLTIWTLLIGPSLICFLHIHHFCDWLTNFILKYFPDCLWICLFSFSSFRLFVSWLPFKLFHRFPFNNLGSVLSFYLVKL